MDRDRRQPPIDRQETVNLPALPPSISQMPTHRLPDLPPPAGKRKTSILLTLAAALLVITSLSIATFVIPIPGGTQPGITQGGTVTPLVFASATPGVGATGTPKPPRHGPPPAPLPTPVPSIQLPKKRAIPTFCPQTTPTPTPSPAPTTTGTPTPTVTPSPVPTPNCVTCPWLYSQQTFTRDEVKAALITAADKYHLPHNLVFAIARLESGWNPYFVSCSYDIGLMQMKYGYWESVDEINAPECGLTPTAYDPYSMQDSAYLGAKMLAWISCYYSYWGGTSGASLKYPGVGTVDWYYQQAHLKYPDTKTASGATNASSLCAAKYNDPNHTEYPALSATANQVWSCPYSATAGDSTLLDITISTYNQGMGTTNSQGITNQWYVNIIEAYIIQYGQSDGVG